MTVRNVAPCLWLLMMVSCATKAPPPVVVPPPVVEKPVEANPAALLSFEGIEARRIDRLTLHFLLKAENPRSTAAHVALQGWHYTVNGLESAGEAALIMDQDAFEVPAFSTATVPLRLEWELPVEPGSATDTDTYQVQLRVNPLFTFETGATGDVWAEVQGGFPCIREPELILTAITVSKAELINTRLKVSLRINNPNAFPVALSSLKYKLYGAGRFWAEGENRHDLAVPARGFAESQVLLTMNFIDMSRQILDEVIAMKQVRYRFTGEAKVDTGIEYLPQFRMSFDRSGNSTVVE
ncbi:MAG: LEA type 2 family protein [Treponema sp.]|nr:LEA type 2 family protein [Treponema sp.]